MPIRSYGPGKFSDVIDGYLYSASLDGGADEECGNSTEGPGWAGLMRGNLLEAVESAAESELDPEEVSFLKNQAGAIMFERTDGIVEIEYFENAAQLTRAWEEMCEDLEQDE